MLDSILPAALIRALCAFGYYSCEISNLGGSAVKELNLRNLTLMALVACGLMQIGAQLFALSVVASTVSAAPPRSFAMLQGEYGYNSSAFWNTFPTITSVLFVIALVANSHNQHLAL